LRSLRSEYDYGSKKKFVDVLLNVKNSELTQSRLQKSIDNGEKQLKSSIEETSYKLGKSQQFSISSYKNRSTDGKSKMNLKAT
jgi:hypothetical protein